MSTQRAGWIGAAVGILVIAVILALGAPQLAGLDVYVFKGPGCALAAGQGFTADALPGYASLTPRLFSSQAPGLPFLYGLYAMALGCGPWTNTLFDLILGLASSLLVLGLVLPWMRSRWVAAAAGAGSAIVGCFGVASSGADRPETLALILFLGACVAAAGPPGWRRDLIAPLLAGLTAIVHPFAGMIAGLAVWTAAMAAAGEEGSLGLVGRAMRTLRIVILFAAPILAVVGLYVAMDPSAPSRFASHAEALHTGPTAALKQGFAPLLKHSASSYPGNAALLAGAVAVVLWTAVRAGRPAANGVLLALCAATVAAPLLLFPGQGNYWRWAAIAILVFLAMGPRLLAAGPDSGRAAPALLALALLTLLPNWLIETSERLQSRASYQTAVSEAARLPQVFQPHQERDVVLVQAANYFLYRSYLKHPANPSPDYAGTTSRDVASRTGAVLACYASQPPGRPFPEIRQLPFSSVLRLPAGSHAKVTVLGKRMSREWGWSCDAYLAQNG